MHFHHICTKFINNFTTFYAGSLSRLKNLNTIALTTNGLVLHKKIKDLKNAGNNVILKVYT